MNLKVRYSRGGLLYFSLMLAGMALSFGKWFVISSVLDVDEFGLYSTAISTLILFVYLGAFGLNEYVIKEGSLLFGAGNIQEFRRIFLDLTLASIILSVVAAMIFMYLLVRVSAYTLHFLQYLSLFALVIVVVQFNLIDSYLRATHQTLTFAFVTFVRALLLVVLGYVLAKSNGLIGLLYAELFSVSIAAFIAYYHSKSDVFTSFLAFSPSKFFTYIGIGSSYLWLQAIRYLSLVVDKWIVGYFYGAELLGYYSFLQITFFAVLGMAGIFNAFVIPRVIANYGYDQNVERIRTRNIRISGYFILVSLVLLPVYVPMMSVLANIFLPQYYLENFGISILALYVASVFHVSSQVMDGFFYAVGRNVELIVLAILAVLILIAGYVYVGISGASVFYFCVCFLISKFILYLCTLACLMYRGSIKCFAKWGRL